MKLKYVGIGGPILALCPAKLSRKWQRLEFVTLFLLDEIDKMGMDHRGIKAAMLEVLDPDKIMHLTTIIWK